MVSVKGKCNFGGNIPLTYSCIKLILLSLIIHCPKKIKVSNKITDPRCHRLKQNKLQQKANQDNY